MMSVEFCKGEKMKSGGLSEPDITAEKHKHHMVALQWNETQPCSVFTEIKVMAFMRNGQCGARLVFHS